MRNVAGSIALAFLFIILGLLNPDVLLVTILGLALGFFIWWAHESLNN